MSAMNKFDMPVEPGFDLMHYLELCGTNRVEHEVMERAETFWKAWKPLLRSYKFTSGNSKDDPGCLLVFLDTAVEDQIQEQFAENQEFGMRLHNLAVALVVSAARDLIPELYDAGDAIPEAEFTAAFLDAAKETGFGLNADSTPTHQYMILTNHPYKGGCETCGHGDNCSVMTIGG